MRFSNSLIMCSAALVAAAIAWPANAQVPLEGYFIARKECPAVQSIKKQTNPGSITTVKDRAYDLLGKNSPAASHYLIKVPEANPDRRWVAVECGEHVQVVGGGTGGGNPPPDGNGDKPRYVLSLSWEPAFCEGKPDKTECGTMTPERFDASHLALHGLWPQPRSNIYCQVDNALANKDKNHDWQGLPEPQLDPGTKISLDKVMPGTMSLLHRHEWIKHGTCYNGEDADSYFRDAIRLIDAINASPVQEFLAANIGKDVQTADIAEKFDEAFGAGAGSRIKVACARDGDRRLIAEITLGLAGDVSGQASIPDAIFASPATSPDCPGGVIDPAGLQ
jgi:ribonuclease T2